MLIPSKFHPESWFNSQSSLGVDEALGSVYKHLTMEFLGQIPLILPDVHVVKLCSVARLYLDLLGHFPAGVDPVALECAEDAIEAAFLDPEPVFQGLNHLPMGMRIFQVHVERGRISGTDPFKSSLAAPEFHAALEVRVKNPHAILSPEGPGWSQLSPEAILS